MFWKIFWTGGVIHLRKIESCSVPVFLIVDSYVIGGSTSTSSCSS